MKLLRLHLQAFGPFTDRWLDLGDGSVGLQLVCGPNEAGKSSTLRALTALRYGIELRSTDDFVHDHPAMRLGAVLLDREGREVRVVRRKGRGQTLSLCGANDTLLAASADLEHQLTGGLKRADFDSLYGLDHTRLRQGGEALLKGEGDVGAALFEASVGVRSLQDVIVRLDQEARRHFVPGARGSKGRINEALRQHGEQAGVLREATLRPTAWVELQRRCEATGRTLAALLDTQASFDREVRQWRERLAVAPLLARLDQALNRCAELASAPVLGEDASARRLTLQASAAEHQQSLHAVQEVLARYRREWDVLPVSSALLLAAPAIERLVAEGERLDQGQREIGEAEAEQVRLEAQLARQLAAIDAMQPVDTLLRSMPAAVLRAQSDAALQALDEAERALLQHRQAMQGQAPVADPATVGGVGTTAVCHSTDPRRVALRAACDAVVRAEGVLTRLAALPAELALARQRQALALSDLGHASAWNVAAVRAACPVLEVDIDLAVRTEDDARTRQRELVMRLAQIEEALRGREAERDQLLSQGVVPTPDDVRTARSARDEAWRMWCTDLASAESMRRVEQAVRHADALVDALVRDAGRAAQLQALQRQIADLARDQHLRQSEIRQLQIDQTSRAAAWRARLQEAGLPECVPESLREWQARLRAARTAADLAETLALEEARATALAAQLRQDLRVVLDNLDAPDAPVATLLALARQREETFARAEQAALALAAERGLRREQHERAQQEERRLLTLRDAAAAALGPVCAALQLPATADAVAARARLQEWEQVRLCADQLVQARSVHARAQRAVADLGRKAAELAATLQESAPMADLRHWIDDVGRRLDEARRLEGRRQVLSQALAEATERQRQHTATLHQFEQVCLSLCAAAGVDTEADLPGAEERARQRREAQQQRDHVRDLLAQVSPRDESELRALVGAFDATQAQAEAQRAEQALADLAPRLDEARQQDEAARRARDAIDSGDAAAQARAQMEQSGAAIRSSLVPWMRARLAQALLAQALGQFRERAQGPMLRAASGFFSAMTGGDYDRLQSEPGVDDHRPVLQIRRRGGCTLGVEGLSEGTRDQLYLALRLAALQLHRERGIDLPLVLDDVLMTSDDDRAVRMLRMLADFAQGGQVLVFTHHRHLLELARLSLPASSLACTTL
ncbi:AAA family ATPase [Sphaerotilus sp.]|uniref:AAA family ATPase n=1 Tax=Sphaerotilus sp. TaxID=2093942 RepID=UPI00286D8A36|nr:AAA family ATPase [Sphaerotilus sp.]